MNSPNCGEFNFAFASISALFAHGTVSKAEPSKTKLSKKSDKRSTRSEESIVGIRTTVQRDAHIRRSVLLGADYYEADDAAPARSEGPRLGVGQDVILDRVIVDKEDADHVLPPAARITARVPRTARGLSSRTPPQRSTRRRHRRSPS